jgi:hypothetical protein
MTSWKIPSLFPPVIWVKISNYLLGLRAELMQLRVPHMWEQVQDMELLLIREHFFN